MNINVESHFATVPHQERPRSVFNRPFTHTTSFNVGELIPVFLDAGVMPGDTIEVRTSFVARLQTLLTPMFGNVYLDITAWAVPYRLVWSHFKEFMGENTPSAWIPQNTYQIPTISAPASTGFQVGSLADYMGYPTGVAWTNSMKHAPSALPFRAYALICDSFWRDQNLTDPLNIPTGDSNQTGTNGSSYINDVANGGKPFKVAKFHDFWTSMLPGPQKGPAVSFPLLNNNRAPVGADNISTIAETTFGKHSIAFARTDGNSFGTAQGKYPVFTQVDTQDTKKAFSVVNNTASTASGWSNIYPTNLWADLSSTVGSVTINQMRLAFQLQKYYEVLARGGSRYTEIIKSLFSVTSPDARLQRPEYLGGTRVALNVHEVANTAQTNSDFLGDLGAMSRTAGSDVLFQKSFTEHSLLLICVCARYDHVYGQGIDPMLLRTQQESWYNPIFASIGEQPYPKACIYADTTTMNSDDVFGFQEAWADYRYFVSDRVSAEMRPGISNTLASWHLADYYTQAPTLSDAWIREDKSNVDRVLAVQSSVSNQIFGDFHFDCKYTRVMPVYSVPGLIDHF